MARIATLPLLLLAAAGLTAARRAPPPAPAVATPAPPTIKAGVEKWRAGDYPAAVAIWTPFAAAGDADAMFNLGQAFKLGRGVTADAATARDYYRRAAAKGHLPAQANLGIALFQAGEKVEAIRWLKTAADRGEARAQYVLGIATFNGDGVPRSQSVGYAYLLRAQASGLPQAVTALGSIAPGLSPSDRSAGETVAASLAAGTGVPTAFAVAPSRLIPAIPATRSATMAPSTPGRAAEASSAGPASMPATAASRAPATAANGTAAAPAIRAATTPTVATKSASPLVTATTTATPPARATPPALASAPKPAPVVPLAEPTSQPADAAVQTAQRSVARSEATAVATVTIPASRPPVEPRASAPGPTTTAVDMARAAARPASVPSKPFQTAVEPAKKPDGWRVQLGAFSARKLADAAWNDVKTDAAPAKPIFAVDGPVTKLQMGPFATRDAAKAACAKLTTAGRACFVTQG